MKLRSVQLEILLLYLSFVTYSFIAQGHAFLSPKGILYSRLTIDNTLLMSIYLIFSFSSLFKAQLYTSFNNQLQNYNKYTMEAGNSERMINSMVFIFSLFPLNCLQFINKTVHRGISLLSCEKSHFSQCPRPHFLYQVKNMLGYCAGMLYTRFGGQRKQELSRLL